MKTSRVVMDPDGNPDGNPYEVISISDDDDDDDVADGDDVVVVVDDETIRSTLGERASVDEKERARLAAAVRALYIRYAANRKTPEDVLDERWSGWRNLAVWSNNSCHADVVLDVVTWSAVWRAHGRGVDGAVDPYDHVKKKYRDVVVKYVNERTRGNANDAANLTEGMIKKIDEEWNSSKDDAGSFRCADRNLASLIDEKHRRYVDAAAAAALRENDTVVVSKKPFDENVSLRFVYLIPTDVTGATLRSSYAFGSSPGDEYVALGAIVGKPGHFVSALNATALANRLDPANAKDADETIARWYVFDHHGQRDDGPKLLDNATLANGENLAGLLLVKKS